MDSCVRLPDVCVRNYPPAFRRLLAGYPNTCGEFVEVYLAPIAAHFEEWEELTQSWQQPDHVRCQQLLAAYDRGCLFPPLVADRPGGLLLDGYHRLQVYRQRNGVVSRFIYTDWPATQER